VTLFPSIVFAKELLPKFGIPSDQAIPPKISKWFDTVTANDEAFAKVYQEVRIIYRMNNSNPASIPNNTHPLFIH